MEKTIETNAPEETERIASDLAKALPRGSVVALYGDLGAGKTVFARGFARGLGITEPLSSPTFTIVQEYPAPGGGNLYHLDLYRIDNSDAALAFGVDEFLNDPDARVLLEWPERIEDLLPEGTVRIRIRHAGEGKREIVLPCGPGEKDA